MRLMSLQYTIAEAAQGDDFAPAAVRGSNAVEAAASATLAESPPPPHPSVPGSDDYAHGDELMKELDQGAWPFLSTECQALYDWQKGLPAS